MTKCGSSTYFWDVYLGAIYLEEYTQFNEMNILSEMNTFELRKCDLNLLDLLPTFPNP